MNSSVLLLSAFWFTNKPFHVYNLKPESDCWSDLCINKEMCLGKKNTCRINNVCLKWLIKEKWFAFISNNIIFCFHFDFKAK